MLERGIRSVEVTKDSHGRFTLVHVVFGPHHFVDISSDGRSVRFVLGTTHHGFEADASGLDSELERIVEEIRRLHPEKTID